MTELTVTLRVILFVPCHGKSLPIIAGHPNLRDTEEEKFPNFLSSIHSFTTSISPWRPILDLG